MVLQMKLTDAVFILDKAGLPLSVLREQALKRMQENRAKGLEIYLQGRESSIDGAGTDITLNVEC